MDQLAPTLGQIFSPARSPFYGMAAVSVFSMVAAAGQRLAGDALPIMMLICAISVIASLAIRTQLTGNQFDYSLVYARASGIIGVAIALAILVNSNSSATDGLYGVAWNLIAFQSILGFFLFFVRNRNRKFGSGKIAKRFNVVQFILINTAIISAIANLSSKVDYIAFQYAPWEAFISYAIVGAGYFLLLPIWILDGTLGGYNAAASFLVFCSILNMAVGVPRLLAEIQFGLKSDLEEIEYGK